MISIIRLCFSLNFQMPGSNIVQEIRRGGANHTMDLSSQVSGPQTEQSQSEVGQ